MNLSSPSEQSEQALPLASAGSKVALAVPMAGNLNGYGLTASLIGSLVDLLKAFAWPGVVLLLVVLGVGYTPALLVDLQKFMLTEQTAKFSASTNGFQIELVAREVQTGLYQQLADEASIAAAEGRPSGAPADWRRLQQTARNAAQTLFPLVAEGFAFKVLWVDDHPANNVGLQYAFQSLGIIVVCITSNGGINNAFNAAHGFDLVITDMRRDAIGKTAGDPEGGLKTIDQVTQASPGISVIIDSDTHIDPAEIELHSTNVLAISDSWSVFSEVIQMATKKAASLQSTAL